MRSGQVESTKAEPDDLARLVAHGAPRLRAIMPGGEQVPDAEWDFFLTRLTHRALAPRSLLFEQGRPASHVFFIAAGLLRLFRNAGRREITLGFDKEDRFVAAYDSVVTGAPASFSAETLEPTELLAFDRATLAELYDRHPCWERVGRLQAERQLLHKMQKEITIRSVSPERRYRELQAVKPWILERVPQYHVASYLGIAPETLSRIRARLC